MPLRLEPVRDRKLHRLAKTAAARATRKGEVIFHRGDPGGQVFLVKEGHVCLRLGGAGEDERTVAVAGPSELFGEEGMIPGAARPYTAVAGERGSVVPMEGAAVRAVLRSSQHTLTAYLEVKERELHLLRGAAGGSPGPSAKERLAAVILDLVERLGEPEEGGLRLPHWFTHRELADLAGAHRSTVTTCLNDWIWRGVLDTRGRALTVTRAGLDALRSEGIRPTPSIDPTPRQD
jgi:CRP-like cAMP-binding protein